MDTSAFSRDRRNVAGGSRSLGKDLLRVYQQLKHRTYAALGMTDQNKQTKKKDVWKAHSYLSVHVCHFPKHSSLDTLLSTKSFVHVFTLVKKKKKNCFLE